MQSHDMLQQCFECCQPCGFPANLGQFFVELRFFLKTCGLLVFGLVFCRFLFFLIAFSSILMEIFCFNLLLKAYWTCFCENLIILGLFFRICYHTFLFNLLAAFSFWCIFLPTHVGLVSRSNYLLLDCFSYFLACFCKGSVQPFGAVWLASGASRTAPYIQTLPFAK